jgi:hypothetical protein
VRTYSDPPPNAPYGPDAEKPRLKELVLGASIARGMDELEKLFRRTPAIDYYTTDFAYHVTQVQSLYGERRYKEAAAEELTLQLEDEAHG